MDTNKILKGDYIYPFNTFKTDKDVIEYVNYIIQTTNSINSENIEIERSLLTSAFLYLYHYTTKACMTFSNIIRLLEAGEQEYSKNNSKTPLNFIFEEVEQYGPNSLAMFYYQQFSFAYDQNFKNKIIYACLQRMYMIINFTNKYIFDAQAINDAVNLIENEKEEEQEEEQRDFSKIDSDDLDVNYWGDEDLFFDGMGNINSQKGNNSLFG